MAGLFTSLLQALQGRRGKDMRFLCRRLLSERGEASQTVVAQEIIHTYNEMNPAQRCQFFEMLRTDFSPDMGVILDAAAEYQRSPDQRHLDILSQAVEPPRQELIRRINTAPGGTETLVAMREHLISSSADPATIAAIDADLKHLFKSWFNRGFLRLERISWQTSALVLEKLIRYESVHEINGWPDLRRRLESDRRCFAFFHPALNHEPIIFVEVALSKGLVGDLEPLLGLDTPVLSPAAADTAIFYSINNCLQGLRGIPFGNFLIKQVVTELATEFPNIKTYCTLSPLPRFARALRDTKNEQGFTPARLSRLLADYSRELTAAAKRTDPVEALFTLLENPLPHQAVLDAPLQRLALAYLTRVHQDGKLYDPVANFHLANGARLERVNAFGNTRPYGLEASFGVTVNYRYIPADLEENHEQFVRQGHIAFARTMSREAERIGPAWDGKTHAAEPKPSPVNS